MKLYKWNLLDHRPMVNHDFEYPSSVNTMSTGYEQWMSIIRTAASTKNVMKTCQITDSPFSPPSIL
jgi:hypothetical protein